MTIVNCKLGSSYSILINDQYYIPDSGEKFITYDESNTFSPTHIYISDSLNDPSTESLKFRITRVSSKNTSSSGTTYLSTTNSSAYTPSENYNPATKKYVDDKALEISSDSVKIGYGTGKTVDMLC